MKYLKLLLAFLILVFNSYAQTGKVYSGTKIKKGVLDNGLTYYIYNNPSSYGKVNYYLIQNVGAILEEDSQNGLAHFLEHMCFNGTENFPDKTILKEFEKRGLGNSINALTGIDQTVYHFTNVPKRDYAFCDECLLMLYDWCNCLTLAQDKIESERLVILEEMRTSNTLQKKIFKESCPYTHNFSKYAKRNIIGTADIIKNFKREELVNFYKTWYRSDLQAIVVIGDIDTYQIEQKIKRLFSRLPKVKKPKERYHIKIPDNKEILYKQIINNEVRSGSISIKYRHVIDRSTDNTFMSMIINRLLSVRSKSLMKKNKKCLYNVNIGYSSIAADYAAYGMDIAYKKDKAKEALSAVIGMHKDILDNGFSPKEFEAIKKALLKGLKYTRKYYPGLPNQYHFNLIQSNFINNADILDPSTSISKFKKFIKNLTTEDIRREMNKYYSGPNQSIIVIGNDQERLLSKEDILKINGEANSCNYKEEKKEEEKTIKQLPVSENELIGSSIDKIDKIEIGGAEKWTLKNGATIIFKEGSGTIENSPYYDPDVINIYCGSKGGYYKMNSDSLINGYMFNYFSSCIGIKGFTKDELKKYQKDNSVGCSFILSGDKEELYLACRYRSIKQIFKYIYCAFEKPAFYKKEFDEFYNKIEENIFNTPVNYKQQISDTLKILTEGKNKFIKLDTNTLKKISFNKFKDTYKDRFSDISNFKIYVVGCISKGKIKKLAEKYIGSINSTNSNETLPTPINKFAQGHTKLSLNLDITDGKSGIIYIADKQQDYSYEKIICHKIIGIYLQDKLQKVIRHEKKGTYGVSVNDYFNTDVNKNTGFKISFECDPNRCVELDSVLHETMVKIAKEGMKQEDLKLIKEKFEPKGSAIKNNGYYIDVLKNYIETGENKDKENFRNDILKKIDLNYINQKMKDFLQNMNIIDLIYKPE